MKAFVTGGAGFIGSTLVDRLLARGDEVVAYDNLSTGRKVFLRDAETNRRFKLIEGDVLDRESMSAAMRGADFVFHLAANADVRCGSDHPEKDLQQNTIATFGFSKRCARTGSSCLAFSSTGSIYGEPTVFPTPEDGPFPVQTSLYGASKLACEGLISAYCEGFGFSAWIFRFVSILGERYTHGHVFDFYQRLRADPATLHVLGNGGQRKSYLYVQDCIDAIFTALERVEGKAAVFNLGADEYCTVNDSIGWITGALGITPRLTYAGGERG